jgi:hypothetical protein
MIVHLIPLEKISKRRIKALIKNTSQPAVYLNNFFKNSSIDSQFRDRKINLMHAPIISNKEKERILRDYVNIVGMMSALNGRHMQWWATDISSKNRLLSPMQETLNQVIISIKAINRCEIDKIDLYILGVSWPVIIFLENFLKSKSIVVRVNSGFLSFFRYKSRENLNPWISLVKNSISSLIGLFLAHRSFSRGNIKKIDVNRPVFLIKSWVFPRSFSDDGSYKDPYCGNLASYLSNNLKDDEQVVTISQGFTEKYQCYRNMENVKGQIVIPTDSFIHLIDVFLATISISWYRLIHPVKMPDKVLLLGCDLKSLLTNLVKSSGRFIRFNDYLYFYLGRRLAKKYNLKKCLLSYEGNHWERMFILGLRSLNPDLKIIGYHHSAIPQAAAGVFLSQWEVDLIPHPDIVLTTGLESANILKKYSNLPDNFIKPGCALVHQYLYHIQALPRRKHVKIHTVLVVLEGVLEAYKLLTYAINQARDLSFIVFRVRSHPSLGFDSLLKYAGLKQEDLPINMEISNYDEVLEDAKICDIVLYWGTATAVEILMLGRPLIWFDRGDVLSFDPLFDFSEFKWIVRFKTPILSVLEKVNNLTDEEYRLKSLKGIEYVSQYFEQCNEKNIKSFAM